MKDKTTDDPVVIIGLGYVGLTLAAFMADHGFQVHGTEIRKLVLTGLEKHKAFFVEANLDNVLTRVITNGTFTFSEKIPEKKNNRSRIFILTVGTPLHQDGNADITFISNVAKEVENVAVDGDFVILRSTVKLGTTNNIVRKILGANGKRIDLAFCPERTLEGAALSELGALPQIIGADSERERNRASEIFSKITSSVVLVSNIETAELIKLTDNVQRDIHFAISNEVARAANNYPIKASEVISAGKLGYPRTNLASPGPVGGPCLEKDSFIFAESLNWRNSLAQSARQINSYLVEESVDFILSNLSVKKLKSPTISILGIAFKGTPETNDLRGSVSLQIYNRLKSKLPDAKICGYDPMVSQVEVNPYGLVMHKSLEESFEEVDVVLLANNNKRFSNLDLKSLSMKMNKPALIYDYWGRFDNNYVFPENVYYSSWGSHSYFSGNHK